MNFVRSRHWRRWQGKRQYHPQTTNQGHLSLGCVLKSLLCALTPTVREDPPYNCSRSRSYDVNRLRTSKSNHDHASTASRSRSSRIKKKSTSTNVKFISGENSRDVISKSKQVQSTPPFILPKPKMTEEIQSMCSTSRTAVHDNRVRSFSPEDTICCVTSMSPSAGQTKPTATSSNISAAPNMYCCKDGSIVEDKEKAFTIKKKINSVSWDTSVKCVEKMKGDLKKLDTGKEKVEKMENARWKILFDRSQKKLKKEITQNREIKYKIKADLREEKCALDLAEHEIKEMTEAIKMNEEMMADMKTNCITNQQQDDLLHKLDKKYHIAKSKLHLSHLDEQLCKLERDAEKRRQKIIMLSHQVHKLAFSIPLVAEAGALDQDEERIIQPEQPTPSVFLPKNSSNSEVGSGSKNIPMCWNSQSTISSNCTQVPPGYEHEISQLGSCITPSQKGFSHNVREIDIIDMN